MLAPRSILDDLQRNGLIEIKGVERGFYELIFTELTQDGQKYLKQSGYNQVTSTPMTNPRLALGTIEFVDVLNFTEPADLLGRKISEVSWRFRVVNVPSWASQSKGIPELAQRPIAGDMQGYGCWFLAAIKGGLISTKAAFVLTSDGWVHERFMR